MQTDFHYYGTYMAARAAGFDKADSVRLGAFAHLVDAGSNDYAAGDDSFQWKPSEHIKKKKLPRTCWKVLSKVHTYKDRGRDPVAVYPWIALHFLPSGYVEEEDQYTLNPDMHKDVLERLQHGFFHRKKREGHKLLSSKKAKRRLKNFDDSKAAKWALKDALITRPLSNTCLSMLEDLESLFDVYAQSTNPETDMEGEIKSRLANSAAFLENLQQVRKHESIKKDGGMDWLKFLLALAGARMHVLADTYAHQGFAGCRSGTVNDVAPASFYYTRAGQSYVSDDLLSNENSHDRTNPIFHPDTQRISGKGMGISSSDFSPFGHGRAGSFPDYPNAYFKYTRPWDERIIRRDNPGFYAEAYAAMVESLGTLLQKVYKPRFVQNAFSTETVNEGFFRNIQQYGKPHRCQFFQGQIKSKDAHDIGYCADDYDVIKWLDEVHVAYFGLAVYYHLQWFQDHFCSLLGFQGGSYKDFMKQALTPLSKLQESNKVINRL